MQAGTLNEPIIIWRQNWEQKTDFGNQKTEEWFKWASTRAAVSYEKGMRVDDNNELFFSQSVNFAIRIYHQIKHLDQIEWKGQRFRILDIREEKALQRKVITTELIND